MTAKDKSRLRGLAAHQAELSNSSKNLERVELWKKHNACKGERPTIHIEVDTFANEVINPQLICEDPFARMLEYRLIHNCINQDLFGDDKVVAPYFQIGYDTWFRLFGHDIKENIVKKDDGTEMGHKFEHIIQDLEDDFEKITAKSDYGVNKESTMRKFELICDVFGDILPVKIVCNSLSAVPTQQIVHMMGMESMLYSIYDYPDKFKEMMTRISDEYIAYFKYLESENVL